MKSGVSNSDCICLLSKNDILSPSRADSAYKQSSGLFFLSLFSALSFSTQTVPVNHGDAVTCIL